MIYRVHPNINNFLMLHLDGDKAREALGEDTDFYLDERPIPYLQYWKIMTVGFMDAFGGGEKEIPDISANVGKLFLSEKAYKLLDDQLDGYGEMLPVIYESGTGYIFNCLKVIDANEQQSMHDPLSDKFSVVFDENLDELNLFKSGIDFDAHFCNESFKRIVEENNLTGISFSVDIGSPFPEELGMRNTH